MPDIIMRTKENIFSISESIKIFLVTSCFSNALKDSCTMYNVTPFSGKGIRDSEMYLGKKNVEP
jgi:hypothetical protein